MKRIWVAALAIVLAGIALVGGIGLAVAQGPDDPAPTFLGRVAEKLGIGEDDLRSAMAEAQQDIIDEQVAAGRLTPEQGERLKERIETWGPVGRLHRLGLRERVCHRVERLLVRSAAAVLGMEPQELVGELKDGKTLAQAAEGQGMAAEDFKAALLDSVQQELNALVTEGKLTEAQADAIYEPIDNIDRLVAGHPGRLHRYCDARP